MGLFAMMIALTAPAPASAQTQILGGAAVTVRITWGSQNKSTAVGVALFGAASGNSASVEAGVHYTLTHNFRMFGIKRIGWGRDALSHTLGWNAQFAGGGHRGFLGLDSGSPNPLFLNDHRGMSVGVGIGQRYHLWLPKKLKEFENVRGTFKIFASSGSARGNLVHINDARVYGPILILLGDDNDHGPTFSGSISADIRDGLSVFTLGIGHDMFTPVPDLSKPPTNTGVRKGKYGTYFTKGKFTDLYHGNTYGFAEFRDPQFQVSLKLGNDSQWWGATLQDWVHNSQMKKPIFPDWDPKASPGLFFEVSASGMLPTRDRPR